MKTVHEVSEISGVSIRTLHYYDTIGILTPTAKSSSGYRLYDDAKIATLETILMYREIGFSLADIRKIITNPRFDLHTALEDHIAMLEMKKEYIEGLIMQTKELMKGGNADFTVFNKGRMEQYEKEAKERWGDSKEFQEYESKNTNRTSNQKQLITMDFLELFTRFGPLKNLSPDAIGVQNLVQRLKDFISANFYNCSNEILSGLGEMYVEDPRFKKNIDTFCGDGTAKFIREAIRIYCAK